MKKIEDAVRDLVSKIYEDVTDFSYTGTYEREIKELSESIDGLIDFKIRSVLTTIDRQMRFYSELDQ